MAIRPSVSESREAVAPPTPQEIFESYVHAVAMTRNADAVAENFSSVRIFRIRDGKIARLRDCFGPELMA